MSGILSLNAGDVINVLVSRGSGISLFNLIAHASNLHLVRIN
jgi:hypothetical protein